MKRWIIVLLISISAIIILVPSIIYATSTFSLKQNDVNIASDNNEHHDSENNELANLETSITHFAGTASGSKQVASAFIVPIHYGHVTLHFSNHSSAATTIAINNNQSSKVYFTRQIAAGSSYTWRSAEHHIAGIQSGDYTITYRSSSSSVHMDYSGIASDMMQKVAIN